MDYSKLSDFEINRSVAIAIGFNPDDCDIAKRGSPSVGVEWNEDTGYPTMVFDYCNNPADAWTIIVENNISLILDNPSSPLATSNCVGWYSDEEPPIHASNQNPLRAAMIVFLLMQESAKRRHI